MHMEQNTMFSRWHTTSAYGTVRSRVESSRVESVILSNLLRDVLRVLKTEGAATFTEGSGR